MSWSEFFFSSDIDECSQPNDCSQECKNIIGSYECFCRIGFKINKEKPTECEGWYYQFVPFISKKMNLPKVKSKMTENEAICGHF